MTPHAPGVELLGERAAHCGYIRQGPVSCSGSFRTLLTLDGHVGISLGRPYDLDVLPALTGKADAHGWDDLEAWASTQLSLEVVDRARLLDMAVAEIPTEPDHKRPPVLVSTGVTRTLRSAPRIVDLTSLWAGPLCAHLLSLTGAEVIKVESTQRPDGARAGSPTFFDALHARSNLLRLDFTDPRDLGTLRALILNADLVLEASRPRALAALGISAEDAVGAGTSWLSITARGRDSNTIGFGDDVAAGAGLVHFDDGVPLSCGDALADPLTGVASAAAAAEALLLPHATLIDVSMHDVAASAATGETEQHVTALRDSAWWVESASGVVPVRRPRTRAC